MRSQVADGAPPLIGRGPHIANALHALRHTTTSVLLVGPGGVGLSAVLAAILAQLRSNERRHLEVLEDLHARPDFRERLRALSSGNDRVCATLDVQHCTPDVLDELLGSEQVTAIDVHPLRGEHVAELARTLVGADLDPHSLDRLETLTGGLPKLAALVLGACNEQDWLDHQPGGLLSMAPGLPPSRALVAWAHAQVDGLPAALVSELAAAGPLPIQWCSQVADVETVTSARAIAIGRPDALGTRSIALTPPLLTEVLRGLEPRETLVQRLRVVLDRSPLRGDAAVAHPVSRRLLAQVAMAGEAEDDSCTQALAATVAERLTAGDPEAIPFARARFAICADAPNALDLSLALDHAGKPSQTLDVARQAEALAKTDTERAIAIDRQASALVRLGRSSDAADALVGGLARVCEDEASTRLQVSLVNRLLHAGRVSDVSALVTPYLGTVGCPQEAYLIASIAASAQGEPARGDRLAQHGMIAGRAEASDGMLAERLLVVAQAVAAFELGHLEAAQGLAATLEGAALAERNRPMQGWSSVISGWIALAGGHALRATERFRAAVSCFTGVGEPVYVAWSVAGLSAALALRGAFAESSRYDSEYSALGVEPSELFAVEAERALALGALWRGESLHAAQRLARAIEAGATGHQWSQALAAAVDFLLIPAADRRDAIPSAHLARIDGLVEVAASRATGPLPRARALACTALSCDAPAAALLDAAVALAATGANLLAARLALRAAHASGDARSRARATLKALALVAQCDDVQLDTSTLAAPRCGARARLVATMAAEGASRQSIAERLSMSRRTVDRHLSDVFTSLGVREQSELGAALSDLHAAAPLRTGELQTGRLVLVGREQAIASVRHHWQEGRYGVNLVGAPGVGRSRLADECASMFELARCRVVRVSGTSGGFGSLGDIGGQTGRRLVIVVDDAHLLSYTALEAVRATATVESAFVVATSTAATAVSNGSTAAALLLGDLVAVEVQPLADQALLQMAEQLLGGKVALASQRMLLDEVRGSPRSLRDLLRGWSESGILQRGRNGYTIELTGPALSLQANARALLKQVPLDQRRALDILATTGGVPVSLLVDLVGDTTVRDLLADAVVTQREGELDLTHELHREVLLTELSAERQRSIAAEVCDACSPDGTGCIDPVRLARWESLAGRVVEAERLLTAARHAWNASDLACARAFAMQAAEGGAGWQARLLLAQILGEDGDRVGANKLLGSLNADSEVVEARVSAALLRSDVALWVDGDADAAEASLHITGLDRDELTEAAKDALDDQRHLIDVAGRNRLPASKMRGVAGEFADAGAMLVTGRPASGAERCRTLLGELGNAPGRHLLADNLVSLRIECLMESGDLTAATEAMHGWHPESAWSDGSGTGRTAGAAVRILLRRGMVARAHALITGALGDPRVRPGSQNWIWLHSCAALAWAMAGNAQQARASLELSTGVPELGVMTSLLRARADAWAEVAAGDPRTAVQRLLDAADRYLASGLVTPAAQLLHDALRLDGSREIAEALRRATRTAEGTLASARRVHADAVVRDDPVEALTAAHALAAAGADLPAAELALGLVHRLHRLGNQKASRDAGQLGQALRERCVGASTPGLLAPAPALTARQAEIARLAATGLPNREIGARLGVSVRTVENQLQRTYERLGISGRQQLAHALRQGSP